MAETTSAVVRPGDKLVILVPIDTTGQDAADYRQQLRDRLPDVEVIVITGTQMAIYRGADNG